MLFYKLKEFMKECVRVFKITKKPQGTEYKAIIKVTAIGIAIIGVIGFLIQLMWQFVR